MPLVSTLQLHGTLSRYEALRNHSEWAERAVQACKGLNLKLRLHLTLESTLHIHRWLAGGSEKTKSGSAEAPLLSNRF